MSQTTRPALPGTEILEERSLDAVTLSKALALATLRSERLNMRSSTSKFSPDRNAMICAS
jgi:hypothetical protein